MILCIGTTPATQRVMVFDRVETDHVNRACSTLDGAAGKAVNVAKVLKALGEDPILTGFFGGDRGENLISLLQETGLDLDIVQVPQRTRECVTVIDRAAGAQTELVEESQPVPSEAFEELLEIVRRRTAGCKAMVLSGTVVPGGSPDFCFTCAQWAREAGALCVVDAKGEQLKHALRAKPDVVKPNREELAATVGKDLQGDTALMDAMRELTNRGARQVIVTAGKAATLAFDGREFWRILAPRVSAVNPIGSGDAFTAGLVWRLLRGDEFPEACRWASAVGTANVLTLMAGEVLPKDVEQLVRQARVERVSG